MKSLPSIFVLFALTHPKGIFAMTKFRIKILYGLLLFFNISTIISAQTINPTLAELIEGAISNNYTLANSQLDIAMIGIDQQKLNDAYLPRLAINGKEGFAFTSIYIKTPDIKIAQLGIDIKEDFNRFNLLANILTVNADAEMLLYAGGKINKLKKALVEKKKAQSLLQETDKQEIISIILTAYDQLALLKQTRIVLDESERRLIENKKTSDKAFGYGLITKYEHQKIEVAQAQLASKILEYEGKRSLLLTQLQLLTHISMERLSLIDIVMQPLIVSETKNGIIDRVELIALDAAESATNYRIQAAKTWMIPKIQAAASLAYIGLLGGRLSSKDPIVPNGTKLSTTLPDVNIFPMFSIGVGFKWDILDGNAGKRDVQIATIELQKVKNQKAETTEKLTLNLANTQTNYNIANAQITLKNKQQEVSENALKQANEEYHIGLIKSTQLIDAENDFQNAALERIQAIYAQRRAAVELLKATGMLTVGAVQ
jgi:outer membrane protein TolC